MSSPPLSARSVPRIVLILSLLAFALSTWSLHRLSAAVVIGETSWPYPFPYPDRALLTIHDWLDTRYPPPPGGVKMHGALQRMNLWLTGSVFASATVACACGIWLFPLLRRPRCTRGFPIKIHS